MLNTYFILFISYVYIMILQYIFAGKRSMSLRKKWTIWYQVIATPPTSLHDFFLNFVDLSRAKGIYALYFEFVWKRWRPYPFCHLKCQSDILGAMVGKNICWRFVWQTSSKEDPIFKEKI